MTKHMGENLAGLLPTYIFPDLFLHTQIKYISGLFIEPTEQLFTF